jgi:hypothetical protein
MTLPGSGILNPGDSVQSPLPAAMKQPDAWRVTAGSGPETSQLAAVKPSGSEPFNTGNGRETLPSIAMPSSGSGLVHSTSGARTPPTTGEKPAIPPHEPLVSETTANLPGTPVPHPGSPVADSMTTPDDHTGPDTNSLKLGGDVQTPPEEANSVTTLVGQALALPLGNPGGSDPQRKTPASPLATVPTGKSPDSGAGTHTKGHRLSNQHPVQVIQAQVGQGVPDVVSTAVGPASQQTVGTVSAPALAPRSPAFDGPVAVAPQIGVCSGDKPAEPNRPAAVDPGKAPPASPDHPSAAAPPPSVSPTVAEAEEFVVRSDAMPETATLTMADDVPQLSLSGTVSSPPPPADLAQPAAPADQIAPALVGILQTTDGQQTVTVHLQPAELGQVQIRIDQTVAGAAHINITAERPETLQLLQRDEPRLQQALDQAGVLSSGRTVSFQASVPAQVSATASRPDSMETGAGGSGQGQNGGTWRQNGDSPNDFGRSPDPDQGQNRTRWFRAGLDITA